MQNRWEVSQLSTSVGRSLLYSFIAVHLSSNLSVPASTRPATDTQVHYIYDDIPRLSLKRDLDKVLELHICVAPHLGLR